MFLYMELEGGPVIKNTLFIYPMGLGFGLVPPNLWQLFSWPFKLSCSHILSDPVGKFDYYSCSKCVQKSSKLSAFAVLIVHVGKT